MEKYERRSGGFEAQGNIDIARNGCSQHTHRFVMVTCDNECGQQGYRVTFRTEPCNGHYYEFVGYVREVQMPQPCEQRCNTENRIADQRNCGNEAADIWPACRKQNCGCARNQQNNAFTYENICREQKNPSLWENWLNRGQNHRP